MEHTVISTAMRDLSMDLSDQKSSGDDRSDRRKAVALCSQQVAGVYHRTGGFLSLVTVSFNAGVLGVLSMGPSRTRRLSNLYSVLLECAQQIHTTTGQ
jgi:hypothetical protein